MHKVWDRPIISNQLIEISSQLSSEVDKVRILSASSPRSCNWLMVPPITSIGPTPNTGTLQTRNIVTSSLPSTSSKANSQPDDLSLQHPAESRLMKRISKAARFQCATSFDKLLSKILSSPNDVDAWYSLLHYVLGTAYCTSDHLYLTNRIEEERWEIWRISVIGVCRSWLKMKLFTWIKTEKINVLWNIFHKTLLFALIKFIFDSMVVII